MSKKCEYTIEFGTATKSLINKREYISSGKLKEDIVKTISLGQQRELVDLALSCTDFKDQARIVAGITDENLLFNLANDKRLDWKVALDVMEKITNQKYLAEIVTNERIDTSYDHRRATALLRITDEKILKGIYDKVDDYFKKTIIERITDMDFLLNIVKNGWLYPIGRMLKLNRQEATKKLRALNDSSINFRLWFEKADL